MKQILLALLLMSLCSWGVAQSGTGDGTESNHEFGLFDEEVDLTPLGWEQFAISAGYMKLNGDGRYTLGFPGGRQVTVLDLDRLGVNDDDSSYWFAVNYRSSESRWGAWFGAWQYDVAGFRVWQDELKLGDETIIPVGAGVATDLSADWYILEATYSFVRTRNVDLGVGFGVHAVELETTFAGRYELGESGNLFINKQVSTLAPLPNLVGYVYWKFAPRWKLLSRYGWFGLSYDKYDGRMTNLHAMLRFDLSDRWDVEAGYQYVKLDVDIEEDNYTSIYDLDFDGPLATIRFKF